MKQLEDTQTADLLSPVEPAPRGRKPLPAAEVVDVQINLPALTAAGHAATELVLMEQQISQRTSELAVQLGYEGRLDIGALEDGIRFYQRRTVEACMELGKRLLLLKELTPHGEFQQRVGLLGIDSRLSRRLMSATIKFSKAGLKPVLAAAGTQTKMLELLVLDDEEIDRLADGESLGEVDLDAVSTMSVTELRRALRDHKQQLEAKDKVLAARTAKVDQLEEKLHKPFKPAKNALARTAEQKEHLDELRTAIQGADLAFSRLAVVVATIVNDSDAEAVVKAANDAAAYLVTRIRDVANANNLMCDTSDEAFGLKPDWM